MGLTEFHRRLRLKRAGAGLEAPLCFPGRPAAPQPIQVATWLGSTPMTGMSAAAPSKVGKAAVAQPAISKAAGGAPAQGTGGVAGPGIPWGGFAQNMAQMQTKLQTPQARPAWGGGMQSPVWGAGLNATPAAATMASFLGGAARMSNWFQVNK